MAFDMGFDYRGTAGYVTDPAYGVPVLAETYPHTYTNANGYSINAGWTGSLAVDRSASVDARLAGINYKSGGDTFTVDLGSGSNPGAGTYTVDLAAGDEGFAMGGGNTVVLKDNTTQLFSITAVTAAANHYRDANGTEEAPGTGSWDLVATTRSVTFATTTCLLLTAGTDNPRMAHFRLTLQGGGGGGAAPALHSLMLLGVGA
jgi:hypothetical protein